jgi:hypothetical protein
MRSFVISTWGLMVLAIPATGQPITFARIANTTTPIPGGTGNFNFFTFPVISEGRVAFQGAGSGSQTGVYTSSAGVLSPAYTNQTPIPSGTGNFNFVSAPAVQGANMVFVGSGSSNQEGVYTDIGGSLQAVANLNTPIPGGTGNFTSFGGTFGSPVLSGASVAFGAAGSGTQGGIYRWTGGTITVVANTSTPQPGGAGALEILSGPAIDGSRVAFFGSRPIGGGAFRTGLYISDGTTLSIAADSTTPIPGGSGNFVTFGSPSLTGQTVVFIGQDSMGNDGVYASTGGQVTRLYDMNTPAPNGVGNFTAFGTEVSVDGANVAFFGVDSAGTPGIFASFGGTLIKIIDSNMMLDGQTINPLSLGLSTYQLSGNQVAFYALLGDGTFGVYTATVVPEPSALALLGAGALVRRLRKRRTVANASGSEVQ